MEILPRLIDQVSRLEFLDEEMRTKLAERGYLDKFLYYTRYFYPRPDTEFLFLDIGYPLLLASIRNGNTSLAKRIIIKDRDRIEDLNLTDHLISIVTRNGLRDVALILEGKYDNCLQLDTNIDDCLRDINIPENWIWEGRYLIQSQWISLLFYMLSLERRVCIPRIGVKFIPETAIMSIQVEIDKSGVEVDRSLPPEIYQQIGECRSPIFIIPVSITIFIDDEYYSAHANMLIFDIEKRTIERFEPHGEFIIEGIDVVDNELRSFASEIGYRYIPTLDFCPINGPQYAEVYMRERGIQPPTGGFCAAFSLLYMHLRILHPDLSREHIINLIMEGGYERTYERILRYARLISIYVQ